MSYRQLISSPTAQGFDLLNLPTFAKTTQKTFERLAPFSQLHNPSSSDALPAITKITSKIKVYLDAIDTSIIAVQDIYQLSKAAGTFCQTQLATISLYANQDEVKGGGITNSKAFDSSKVDTDALRKLADKAFENAQKTSTIFRQAQQDFYKIAATTKEMEQTVHIPVDPALPKTIVKPIKEISSDLVANLNLLAEFTAHATDLTTWCNWVKTGLTAIGENTVIPSHTDSMSDIEEINKKWDKIRADALIYHSMIGDMQNRYTDLLPLSITSWEAVANGGAQSWEKQREKQSRNTSHTLSHKMSDLMRDAVRHLACHGCFTV